MKFNRQLITFAIAAAALLSIAGVALRTLENRHPAPDCALTQEELQEQRRILVGDGKWDMTNTQEPEPIMPGPGR